jgi:hypothetical protein
MDHKTRGVYVDGSAVEGNAASGSMIFKNNILAGYGQRATEIGGSSSFTANAWVAANANDTLVSSANILTNPYSWTAPDFRPAVGSIALSGASFTTAAIAAATKSFTSNVVASTPQVFCIGDGVTVTPAIFVASTTLSAEYCSLSWSVSPGVTISSSTAINPSFTISTEGSFTVTLMVSDANGDQTSMSTITTNTCTDVSVKEISNQIGTVSLYPNPAKEAAVLSVNAQNAVALNVNVYDITGKLVLSPVQNRNLTSGENKFAIDTKELQNGIYFVTLTTANGKETVKLVVNK